MRKSTTKRRLTQLSVGCAVLSGIFLLAVAVTEQKANSLKDEAQEAVYLYEKVAEAAEKAQVVWEFSRAFRNLRDIETAVGVDSLGLQVAETNYFWTRSLALVFTRNGACGLTNFALGSKTERTNLVVLLPEGPSVEAFNSAYRNITDYSSNLTNNIYCSLS